MKQINLLQKLAFTLALILSCSAIAETKHHDLQPIFNGKDLKGWKVPDPNPFWKVKGGVLVGENDEAKKGSAFRQKIVEG